MKNTVLVSILAVVILGAVGYTLFVHKKQEVLPISTSPTPSTMTKAIITTTMGTIEVELDPKRAPLATANFTELASAGFYNGVRFHRVIAGFMIQAGDPLSKDDTKMDRWGTGGPGKTFKDELYGDEEYSLGTLAMANAGPNTNGSQFFIVTANPSVALPPSYTVFGKVTRGIETALAIEKVATTGYPSDRPLQPVTITSITLSQ